MIAGKWGDAIVGVDIHWVLVPAPPAPAPIPTPLPHPFVGVVFDPLGLAVGAAISAGISLVTGAPFAGPVMINGSPAANTGTDGTNKLVMPHIPTPPGVGWAPVPAGLKPPIPGKAPDPGVPTPVPSNDAVIITGSKTVYINNTNASRLGDLAMSCGEPIRLPSSTVIAVPMGPPVLVGGPPALDFAAAIFGAIRTSWVSGRLNALANRVFGAGSRAANWASKIICAFTGHPVDVASGMVMADAVDIDIPGTIPVRLERTYYSRSEHRGAIGHGWGHSWDRFVRRDIDRVTYHDGDGRDIYFEIPSEGGSVRNITERLVLAARRTRFEIVTADAHLLTFEDRGRDDGTWPLTRVDDANGNQLNLVHDAAGRLVRVADADGRTFDLMNDEAGLLRSVEGSDPLDSTRRITLVRFDYSAEGDLVAVTDATGQTTTYEYVNHLLVRETDRTGLSFYFSYDGADATARCLRTWGDGGIYDHVLTYDAEKGITLVEDSRGNTTVYHANADGLIEKKVDALGGVTLWDWDAAARNVAETDATGAVTRREYDAAGNMIAEVDPLGHRRQYDHTVTNEVARIRDRRGSVWERRYDSVGNLTAARDPAGSEWRFAADRKGRLRRMADPAGNVFSIDYDDASGITTEKDWAGHVTRTRVDGWSRPVDVQLPTGGRISIAWDLLNRVTSIDAHGLTRVDMEYDAEGNLVRTWRNGRVNRRMRYTGYHRLAERFDALGRRQGLRYDTEMNLVEVETETGQKILIEYDAVNRAVRETTVDGRTIELGYDAAGRRTRYRENSGIELRYTRDAAGNIVVKEWSDGDSELFEYDEEGALLRAGNNAHAVSFTRDLRGRIIEESCDGRKVRSVWDARGRLGARIDAWGHRTSYRYDANGECTGLELPGGRTVEIERDALGNEIRRGVPGGAAVISRLDAFGILRDRRIVGPGGADQETWGFDYSPDLEIAGMRSSRWGDYAFAHDAAGRLTGCRTGSGEASEYVWDDADNLLHKDGEEARYGPGNRLLALGDEAFEYDPHGRIIERLRHTPEGSRREWSYEWTASGRLRAVTSPEGVHTEFSYDSFGRRTRSSTAGRSTTFVWAGDELLGEEGADGRTTCYWYEPEARDEEPTFDPLAASLGDHTILFCTDAAGLPRAACDEHGTVVWAADFLPWGGMRRVDGNPALNRLRFAGQQLDPASGLHYNRFRWYDPRLGRYLTPDPAGLAGGLNEYRYVPDPISWIDPFGLAPFEKSHSFSKYLLRAIRESGEAFTDGSRLPGQTVVRLGRHVHRAFHDKFDELLPTAARSVRNGAAGVADNIRNGLVTPKQIADALEKAAKATLRKGSRELADTLAEIRRLRKCGGF